MKKFILVLVTGLLLSTAAFADHEGLGIGLILGGGGSGFGAGIYGGSFNPGLSLKVPSVPIFWGIYGNIGRHHFGLSVTGDYYIFDKDFFSNTVTNEDGSYKVRLGWYLGVGGAISLNFWDGGWGGVGLGVRFPIGLSWHVVTPFEIALGLIPTFGIFIGDYGNRYVGFWWDIGAELIFRLWLK